MTRRKQNYPKRLKSSLGRLTRNSATAPAAHKPSIVTLRGASRVHSGKLNNNLQVDCSPGGVKTTAKTAVTGISSPSDGTSGQGQGDSGGENSPVATDEEEEDEEEDPTGDNNDNTPTTTTSPPSPPPRPDTTTDHIHNSEDDVDSPSAAATSELANPTTTTTIRDDDGDFGGGGCKSAADPIAENPSPRSTSLEESRGGTGSPAVSSRASASSHTPTTAASSSSPSSFPAPSSSGLLARPPPPSPPALSPLASLSRMTVPASLEDSHAKNAVTEEVGGGGGLVAGGGLGARGKSPIDKVKKKTSSASRPNHASDSRESPSCTTRMTSSLLLPTMPPSLGSGSARALLHSPPRDPKDKILSSSSAPSSSSSSSSSAKMRGSPAPGGKSTSSLGRHHRVHSDFYERMAAQALAAATLTSTVLMETPADEQPLDLSRKSSRPRSVSDPDPAPHSASRKDVGKRKGSGKEGAEGGYGGSGGGGGGGGLTSNGISSLESLQKRFGGDFLMDSPRRPSSIIPLQSTILPSKSILRAPPVPGNGLSHLNISAAAAAAAAATSSSSSTAFSGGHLAQHHAHQQQQPHHHHHHHHHHQSTKPKSTGGGSKSGSERADKPSFSSGPAANNSNSITSTATTTTTAAATASLSNKKSSLDKAPSSEGFETSLRKDTESAKAGKSGLNSSGGSGAGGAGGGGGSSSSTNSSSRKKPEEDDTGDSKYTIHRCSCQKSFGTLYALSAHLQETGHVPGSSKQASLMDYPKLVRGQDMWLNQESEQTRRILRCMQCGESFKSLPMLTVHMMQTQHYSKIVSAEHGRRSHKCSAYCDRELDKECIFKCKVCQETYSDMEGLANHMIVSGHHKKQVLRSHNYSELGLRHKHRKRFLSDEASSSTVASLLEYKRKYQGGSGGSNGYLPQVGRPGVASGSASSTAVSSPPSDEFVTCEVCGKKIEVQFYMDHIRVCLRQKAEVIDALKHKLSGEEGNSGGCGPSKLPPSLSARPESKDSLDALEQPLPSTRDSALFKRLNSLTSSPCEKESAEIKPGVGHKDDDGDGNTEEREVEEEEEKEQDKEQKVEATETDVNRNESQDVVAKIQTKDSDIPSVKSKDNDNDDSPRSSEVQSEEVEDSHPLPKKDGTAPSEESASEEPPGQSKLCTVAQDHSSPPPQTSTEDRKNVESSIPPRIPSPMTDEDNTSERSPCPSPESGMSQSGDSKPSSPMIPPPTHPSPSPSPSRPSPPPKNPDSTCIPTLKRERESDGEKEDDEDDAKKERSLKKTKVEEEEEEPDKKRQADPEDLETIRKKIKVEVIEEEESPRRSPPPPPPASLSSTGTSSLSSASTAAGKILPERSGKPSSNPLDKSLDIIDPNSGEEPAKASGSSALKAMESFIQRSFSSKFDSRRNSMSRFGTLGSAGHLPMMGLNRMVPRSSSSPSSSTSSSAISTMSYLSSFSKFLSPLQPSSSSASSSSSKYLDVAMDTPLPSFEKSVLSSLSAKSAELLEKTQSARRDFGSGNKLITSNGLASSKTNREAVLLNKTKPSATSTSRNTDSEREGSEDEKDGKNIKNSDADLQLEKAGKEAEAEDLANKYLNLEEEEANNKNDKTETEEDGEEGSASSAKPSTSNGSSSGKKSALDSLSSFVYGQPMTSEHPLDSLQKLLTKTSIPKMMSTAAASAFQQHFNPHHYPFLTEQMMERMCFSPPDVPIASSSASASASAMPLNLSMKPGGGGAGGGSGGGGGEASDEEDGAVPECDSPSTSREVEDGSHGSSPGLLGPDGELTEYKCAACSRRFASKGSYRYHLSRCHLSSVKKYGIKEAFNMSPYVYLPLDHTAKFTKYYQMAQELASKGK